MIIYEVLYTWCLRYNIYSTRFLDIRILSCFRLWFLLSNQLDCNEEESEVVVAHQFPWSFSVSHYNITWQQGNSPIWLHMHYSIQPYMVKFQLKITIFSSMCLSQQSVMNTLIKLLMHSITLTVCVYLCTLCSYQLAT